MNTTTVRVATDEGRPLFCKACGDFYDADQTELLLAYSKTTCACGATQYDAESAGVAIRANEAHLLEETSVLETTWFHVTARENWASDILEPAVYENGTTGLIGHSTLMVHLGSIDSAKERARTLVEEDTFADAFYLYEIRLKPDTQVNPYISDDRGARWPEVVAETQTDKHSDFAAGATRYVNRFEAHGSVSLLVDATSIEVIRQVQVDPLQFSLV